jgi:hypothetical protein
MTSVVVKKAVHVVDSANDAPAVRVGRFLVSRGFQLATCGGSALEPFSYPHQSSIGILCHDSEIQPKTYLWGLFKEKPRRAWIGVIWFESVFRGAHEGQWVVDVYGSKYLERLTQLSQEMTSMFHTAITVDLISNELKTEFFGSDIDY